jgi:hypothetical protein
MRKVRNLILSELQICLSNSVDKKYKKNVPYISRSPARSLEIDFDDGFLCEVLSETSGEGMTSSLL